MALKDGFLLAHEVVMMAVVVVVVMVMLAEGRRGWNGQARGGRGCQRCKQQ